MFHDKHHAPRNVHIVLNIFYLLTCLLAASLGLSTVNNLLLTQMYIYVFRVLSIMASIHPDVELMNHTVS